jgi:hypothetical protein
MFYFGRYFWFFAVFGGIRVGEKHVAANAAWRIYGFVPINMPLLWSLRPLLFFWFYKHGGPNGPWALALNCFDGRDGFVRLEDARNLGMEKVQCALNFGLRRETPL